MRLGFYNIFEERFNVYYSDTLRGRFLGNGIFLEEFDRWMHEELQHDNWLIAKKGLINPKDAVDTAIILSSLMIMKYSNDIFDLIYSKDRRGNDASFSKDLFSMILFDETIESMKKHNTINLDDAETLWNEFDNIKKMRIKEGRN